MKKSYYLCPMKPHFHYSSDIYGINAKEIADCCVHLICLEGGGSFVFNGKGFSLTKNCILVVPNPAKIENINASENSVFEWFAAPNSFLGGLLPSNNYSIGGSISLNANPVIPLSESDAQRFIDDIRRIRHRLDDSDFLFYIEIIGSLCLTMMYDIFEFHAKYYGTTQHTDRAGYIVSQLMDLLSTGICRTEREMRYYAERLNVSPKYLSATVRRMTGNSVTSFIDRHAVPILKKYLNDRRLSITQICEKMNFTTLSYFSRYCKKHLGMSPQEYRKSLQPTKSSPRQRSQT